MSFALDARLIPNMQPLLVHATILKFSSGAIWLLDGAPALSCRAPSYAYLHIVCLVVLLVGLWLGSLLRSPEPAVLPVHNIGHVGKRARKSLPACYVYDGISVKSLPASDEKAKTSVHNTVNRNPRSSRQPMVSAGPPAAEDNKEHCLLHLPTPNIRSIRHL